MNRKAWERKVRELQCEKVAAGDYISREDAEKIIERIFGSKPKDEVFIKNNDYIGHNFLREQKNEW